MNFFYLLTHFPAIIPSILLGVLIVFWLLAIAGMFDFDAVGPDWVGGEDGDAVPESLLALGLDRLPFSIVISGVVFFWWLLTMLALSLAPVWYAASPWLVGGGVLVVALLAAVPLAAICLRPLKPLFVVHPGASHESVIGRSCRILTLSVEENFGQAEVDTGGARLNIKVYAGVPNSLVKGSTALIIDLDRERGRYLVEAYDPPS
ncbi:hypothetical protein [Tahibacter amnicola]|uniref:Membrane protein implicated in regulation of membrane protease activity n=1 Tax=Tahibacter amnicola TaxID=2976241 RepID=A0ABY6BE07_9GAMM|nr:hypothetical protein [Tahibacter amnicola]UXI68271.1 hypothetical protein N4264_01085 [Tahibacter amnicola]